MMRTQPEIQTLTIQFCGEKKKEGSSLPVNHKMAAMTICLLPPTVQENVHTLNLSVLVPPEGAFEGIKMVPQQVNP